MDNTIRIATTLEGLIGVGKEYLVSKDFKMFTDEQGEIQCFGTVRAVFFDGEFVQAPSSADSEIPTIVQMTLGEG